jgi:hypothetical protein
LSSGESERGIGGGGGGRLERGRGRGRRLWTKREDKGEGRCCPQRVREGEEDTMEGLGEGEDVVEGLGEGEDVVEGSGPSEKIRVRGGVTHRE